MAPSDTDEEADAIEDIDFDLRSSDAEDVNDEDVLDAEGDADEGTEADDVRPHHRLMPNWLYLILCTR